MSGDKLDKIRGLNTLIVASDSAITQADDELAVLRHIDDDAQRDAAVSENYDDRAGAKMTNADVVRMEKQVHSMERSRDKLVAKRDKMIKRLAAR